MSKTKSSRLITEFFPTVSRPRKRITAKERSLEQERLKEYFISKDLDPSGFMVEEFDGKGKGVIALEHIPKGSFVCEYSGDLIKLNDAKGREKKYAKEGAGCYMYYFDWNNSKFCIDATYPSGRLGRLINHSRKAPNCKTEKFIHNGVPHLIFVALKDIEPQQELLYDYGDTDRDVIEAHPWLAST